MEDMRECKTPSEGKTRVYITQLYIRGRTKSRKETEYTYAEARQRERERERVQRDRR